jgi:hypothetical protein
LHESRRRPSSDRDLHRRCDGKIPEFFRPNQGFWYMSNARTDFAMFCSVIFLVLAGGGCWALDAQRGSNMP